MLRILPSPQHDVVIFTQYNNPNGVNHRKEHFEITITDKDGVTRDIKDGQSKEWIIHHGRRILIEEMSYTNGRLHGEYVTYNHNTGLLASSALYKRGIRYSYINHEGGIFQDLTPIKITALMTLYILCVVFYKLLYP